MTKADLKERARELRRQGWTYPDIARELGVSKSSCSLWLRDLPRPRPVAAPEVAPSADPPRSAPERRARARELRAAGLLLREIAEELAVTTATVSSWCAGQEHPARSRHGGDEAHVRAMAEARWAPLRDERDRSRAEVHRAAEATLGRVTGRDLLVALAVSYWCEGAKAKPWNPQESVHWMNSDPGLVALFLAGLSEAGVSDEQLTFRLSIHERADEVAARHWWAAVVGVEPDSFARSTLKRHNPTTVRHRSGEDYRGCLTIRVKQSRTLYQYLDGLVRALVAGAGHDADAPGAGPVPSSVRGSGRPSAVG